MRYTSENRTDLQKFFTHSYPVIGIRQKRVHCPQGISGNIATLDVDPFNQHVVEEELGALSVAALSTYVADRVIKASRVLVRFIALSLHT